MPSELFPGLSGPHLTVQGLPGDGFRPIRLPETAV